MRACAAVLVGHMLVLHLVGHDNSNKSWIVTTGPRRPRPRVRSPLHGIGSVTLPAKGTERAA
jgi:hypothetical protein